MSLLPPIDQWTLETVLTVVREKEYEPGQFEYKEFLQPREGNPRQKNDHRDSIRKTVCGMANTSGGYILFGVIDRKREPSVDCKDRIVGISLEHEPLKEFGDLIQCISPDIPFQASTSPIRLEQSKNRGVFVVQVYKSLTRPHMFDHKFWKRAEAGSTIPMDVTEIREQMLNTEERIRRLVILRHEIQQVQLVNMHIHRDRVGLRHTCYRFSAAETAKVLMSDICFLLPTESKISANVLEIATIMVRYNLMLDRLDTVEENRFRELQLELERERPRLNELTRAVEDELCQLQESLTGRKVERVVHERFSN